MKLLTALFLCALLTVVPACRQTTSSGLIVGTGTIVPTAAECSSWFLRADSGLLYELTNLGSEFQHVDLRVRFTLRERNDRASICMRGTKAEVVSMTKL